MANKCKQEGQHPLTGQRAAIFRLPMGVSPFAFRYQGNGAAPCQYIGTTRKAIDCATNLPLRVLQRTAMLALQALY